MIALAWWFSVIRCVLLDYAVMYRCDVEVLAWLGLAWLDGWQLRIHLYVPSAVVKTEEKGRTVREEGGQ